MKFLQTCIRFQPPPQSMRTQIAKVIRPLQTICHRQNTKTSQKSQHSPDAKCECYDCVEAPHPIPKHHHLPVGCSSAWHVTYNIPKRTANLNNIMRQSCSSQDTAPAHLHSISAPPPANAPRWRPVCCLTVHPVSLAKTRLKSKAHFNVQDSIFSHSRTRPLPFSGPATPPPHLTLRSTERQFPRNSGRTFALLKQWQHLTCLCSEKENTHY